MAGPHGGRQDVIELVSRGEQRELGTAPGVEGAGRVPSQPLGRAGGHWTGQWGAGAGLAGGRESGVTSWSRLSISQKKEEGCHGD